jgi:hypothetical protein
MMTNHRRWSINSRNAYDAILAVLALGWLSACTSVQASGPIPHMTSIVADDMQCRTSSDNLVADMPGMAGVFVQGGASAEPLVVAFVGSWPKPTSGTPAGAFIFLEIDNNRVDVTSTNGGVLVHEGTAASVSNGTHGFNFVTDPIPPGSHTAKMRWADNVLSGSGTICVAERSMVIHHTQ